MGNPKKTNKKPDDIQKYPISKIEPVTSNISFPNNEMSKPKQKTIFGRMKQKFGKKPTVSHISYKSLNEDRASVIFPSGRPLGKPSSLDDSKLHWDLPSSFLW